MSEHLRRTGAAVVLAAVVLAVVATASAPAEADGDVRVLLDHGNGSVEWTSVPDGTVGDVLMESAERLGVVLELSPEITVDGLGPRTIGSQSTGGTFVEAGSTGATVSTGWHVFGWRGGVWEEVPDASVQNTYGGIALGYYPAGVAPAATPDCPVVNTMFRGDAMNTGSREVVYTGAGDLEHVWTDRGTAHAGTLYAGGCVYQKFGIDSGGFAHLVCYDVSTGEERWSFAFMSGANYESSTPLIAGDSIYVGTLTSHIYRIPLAEGPGQDNVNVTSFGGSSFEDAEPVPTFGDFEVGTTYDAAFTSLVYDSGAIYTAHSNGMVYCFDLDLNLIWSYKMNGSTYFLAPTVCDGILYTGALDGHMYIMDSATGDGKADAVVYQVKHRNAYYGGLGQISVIPREGSRYTLIFTVSDGLGMGQKDTGIAVYDYDAASGTLAKRFLNDKLGVFGRYVTPVVTDGFTGAYTILSDGSRSSLIRIDCEGSIEHMTEGLCEVHSPLVFVNGDHLYAVSYSGSDPIYKLGLDGAILGVAGCPGEIRDFNMIPLLVLGDMFIGGTDSGLYRMDGVFAEYVEPAADRGMPVIAVLSMAVGAVLLALGCVYVYLRAVRKESKPFAFLREEFLHYIRGEDYSHNTRSRHRLKVTMAAGIVMLVAAFTACVCIGSASVQSPAEAFGAMFSAISKGGVGLDVTETDVFASRLPRAIAAFAVGVGLSIAGCIYQAIIRNPLVDPYIMGVSSGAGVAAIAVIAFDFTFFGLFSPHSIFLTAITAAIGGLVAFGCTMLLAEKSGGQAINYVLSGVVIGLAFSAVQTIMLTMAGHKLSNALTWLYGSFAEVTWSQVGVIVPIALLFSLVPMFWAKEMNLVLLGEDQARQMGLDVKRFNRWMLVLASVLTSVCVAFVGVIGFVGLVIPHLCRMILGSDHRMVLPASICFGGVMLMLSDLLARTGYYGMELPVGAITTVIGIPVFAYLLIKKGRMYDG